MEDRKKGQQSFNFKTRNEEQRKERKEGREGKEGKEGREGRKGGKGRREGLMEEKEKEGWEEERKEAKRE